MCSKCAREKHRKCIRPSLEELIKETTEKGYEATGRKYGVSGNAIRKWMK